MDLIDREQALGCFWAYEDGDEMNMPAYDRLQALPIVAEVEDCISREDAKWVVFCNRDHVEDQANAIDSLPCVQPSAQPDSKYEYHYDHTDCIWYRPEARNRCPSTCAQYRDGWNDAMNYIFRDGKGYRPYRRDKQYGE